MLRIQGTFGNERLHAFAGRQAAELGGHRVERGRYGHDNFPSWSVMPLLVGSVIRRHLRPTSGFRVAEPGVLPPHGFRAAEGEEVIGWYIDEPCGPSVIFTTVAFHIVSDGQVETILLADVLDYELPASKRKAEGVVVRTPSGRHLVPMSGAHGDHGRFPDAWNLVQVLHVLVKDRTAR
jgi:hypothetical protein